MLTFFTIVHVLLCVFMIFVILLQPGKDSGGMGALGGGASTSAFGGRGAVTFLTKVTGVCAALFFLTSLGLSFVGLKTSVLGTGTSVTAKPPAPAGDKGGTPIPATGVAPQPEGQTATPAQPATPAAQQAPAAAPSGTPAPASNPGK